MNQLKQSHITDAKRGKMPVSKLRLVLIGLIGLLSGAGCFSQSENAVMQN